MHILHPDNLRIVDITTLRHTTKGKKQKFWTPLKITEGAEVWETTLTEVTEFYIFGQICS